MSYTQEEIDVFVSKLLAIERRQASTNLSREDRKELALSIGVSEEVWLAFENDFEGYLQRGHSFREGGNDDDAIAEYMAAFLIDPYHEGLLFGLARAHKRRFHDQGDAKDKAAAEKYARRLLEINPRNRKAVSIINDLKASPRDPTLIISLSVLIGAGLGIVLGFAMRRVSLGIVVGVGVGLAIGMAISQIVNRRRR